MQKSVQQCSSCFIHNSQKTETTQILIDKLAEDWIEKTQELEKITLAINDITKKDSEN